MNERKTMPQAVRTAVTVLNMALIVVGLIVMLVLALGTAGAKKEGTFSLFGRSYHLNQSEQMSPIIEKNDLIAIRKTAPTSFQMGDLIAYYQTDGGREYLIIDGQGLLLRRTDTEPKLFFNRKALAPCHIFHRNKGSATVMGTRKINLR